MVAALRSHPLVMRLLEHQFVPSNNAIEYYQHKFGNNTEWEYLYFKSDSIILLFILPYGVPVLHSPFWRKAHYWSFHPFLRPFQASLLLDINISLLLWVDNELALTAHVRSTSESASSASQLVLSSPSVCGMFPLHTEILLITPSIPCKILLDLNSFWIMKSFNKTFL